VHRICQSRPHLDAGGWGQCRKGLPFGALRRHVDLDKVTAQSLHAELRQVVAGRTPGRESNAETILF
jgi:alanine dehydrogenase